jgi:hypothetical protein
MENTAGKKLVKARGIDLQPADTQFKCHEASSSHCGFLSPQSQSLSTKIQAV